MKTLVKPFGEFVGENQDHDEIRALGFDSRTELVDTDAIAAAVDDHFIQSAELHQKWREFEEVLAKLTAQFAERYRYDRGDLLDLATVLAENGVAGGFAMDVAVSQELQKRLL